MRCPQPGQPPADDGDIGIGVTIEGGAGGQIVVDRRVPEAQRAVVDLRGCGRAGVQSRFPASVSTRRRIASISSNSAGPIVSGGAS